MMDGLWVFLLLIGIATLPVILVYLWFRFRPVPVSPCWFLVSLLAGALSLLVAALMQNFFFYITRDVPGPGEGRLSSLLFNVFIRVALTEETGRILVLLPLFWLGRRIRNREPQAQASALSPAAFGAATGLLTGLGFAIIENASYGAADLHIALLRAFTATPLHGACGARIGYGLIMLKEAPRHGLVRILSAVAIHGMYNMMVLNPGVPGIFPVLIALSALAASIQVIR
ncbi:MAG: PrsW family intramembrane metalloprotease [Treponema sp.]|jgi:RsiW-degrading membrane proteinase PrsW (M82 family)|nr:PrsW family intramembrane metalloprotease [Treponema sp.]